MKKFSASFIALFLFCGTIISQPSAPFAFKQPQRPGISFCENRGQVHDQNNKERPDVMFGATAGNLAVHIKTNGLSYQLHQIDRRQDKKGKTDPHARKEVEEQRIYRIDLTWLNANKNFNVSKDETLAGFSNYYLENCPEGALNVRSYAGVVLHEVYSGINIHYYEKQGELKHDYIVAPHADYQQIKLKVEGAAIEVTTKGSLLLKTPLGKIEEGKPVVFQNGKELNARWVVEKNCLSFEIEQVDPNYELIIDPVTRLWGTYYGGFTSDYVTTSRTDPSGDVYLAGYTNSGTGTLIATSGSHQQSFGGGPNDAFLAKMNSSGIRLWSTYYGGSSDDIGNSCATDGLGNAYLAGYTNLGTGTTIASTGSHQQTNGGSYDAFLVKFNTNGVRQWGSYYGGAGNDYGYGCCTDGSNNVYLAGYSDSGTGTVIATSGAHQPTFGGGSFSGFLVKFNSGGVRQWGTYYGGTVYSDGYACATDGSGNVYLAGTTQGVTGTVISTSGSHQPLAGGGGSVDAYLVKFNSSGVRQWGTYYGGGGVEIAYSCATDGFGNVFLSGGTQSNSGTSIATSSGHQPSLGGNYDAFLVKFNSSGVRLWGTYYGGGSSDNAYCCITDASGNAYMSGYSGTNTGTTIASAGSYQQSFGGGSWDAFLVKFDPNGLRKWGTYYGGTGSDFGYACSVDAAGNVYLAGTTTSSSGTLIASAGSYQQTYGGGTEDGFLVRFVCPVLSPIISITPTICAGLPINFSVSIVGSYTPAYSWTGPNSFSSSVANASISSSSSLNIGVYTLTVDNDGCIETTTAQINSIFPLPTITVNSGSICSGNTFTINPSGAATYTIQGGAAFVSPSVTTSYSVIGTSSLGCPASSVAISNVSVFASPTIAVNSGSLCFGNSFTLSPSGASIYLVQGPGINTVQSGSSVVSPTINSTYSISGASNLGCAATNTVISTVAVHPVPTIAVNSGSICSGNAFTISPAGAATYSIQGGSNIVSPVTNTSYTVTGTSSLGCLSANTAVCDVTVFATPTIAIPNGSICIGETFTINPGGANTYTIEGGAQVVSPTVTSTYSIAGTSTAGCSSSGTVGVTVYVNPLPVLVLSSSDSVLCVGEDVTLTVSGALQYTFSPGGTGSSLVISPSVATIYTVTGTDANGCKDSVTYLQEVEECLGISKTLSNNNKVLVYPNPLQGIFFIEIEAEYDVTVINAFGQKVYENVLVSGIHPIDLQNFAKGIYILHLRNNKQLVNLKILKE